MPCSPKLLGGPQFLSQFPIVLCYQLGETSFETPGEKTKQCSQTGFWNCYPGQMDLTYVKGKC